jgi:hypothetical protein
MIRNYVQYRCGHTKWVALPRIKAERKQKEEWLVTQLCADCQRQRQRDLRVRQTIKDLEDARRRGLVELRGSETMIVWALRIRAECLAEIELRFAQRRTLPDATDEVLHRGLAACIRAINRYAEASWWIDHLNELPQILTLDYMRELVSDPYVVGRLQSSRLEKRQGNL